MPISLKRKSKEWFIRYFPAEVAGTITAMTLALLSQSLINNLLLSSFIGTWGENLGYYGYFLFKEIKTTEKSFRSIAKKFIHLILEFGPAECLDSFFLRPALMFYGMKFTNNLALGLLLGKLLADSVFYFFVILAYEGKNKFRR